ncbi:ABC transporter permease, partial [Clostridium perfringens]|nr:ABC transporter permease [Clostridium perfringens]
MARTGAIQSKMMLLVLLPLILWISAFELLPIAGMIVMSFQDDAGQGFSLGQYVKSFSSPLYQQAIINSVKVSFFSSIIAILIAIVCAYSITRFTTRVRDIMLMISNMITN